MTGQMEQDGAVRIAYVSRPGATPQAELSALTDAYAYLLDSAKKEGTRPGAPDDAERSSSDGANRSIPK